MSTAQARRWSIAMVIIAGSLGASSLSAQVVGDWTGTLKARGVELALELHVTGADSTLAVTLDSPDQGAFGIPASAAVFTNDTLKVEFAAIGGTYLAKLSKNKKLDGMWTQNGRAFPLVLKRSESKSP